MRKAVEAFIARHFDEIQTSYVARVRAEVPRYRDAEPAGFLTNTRRLLTLFGRALDDPRDPELQSFLAELCTQRLAMGMQLGDILEAMFLYDDVMLPVLLEDEELAADRSRVVHAIEQALQTMALRFAETFVALQMAQVERQRLLTLEMSTPVIKVWDGILTLPLIGAVDGYRAKRIMEELLRAVSDEQADIVLLDITGVPVVDTNVADHLIRTIRAVELLGAQCLIVGIAPEFAQTVIGLGVHLESVTPYKDMREGLTEAFRRLSLVVVKKSRDGRPAAS